MVQKRDKTINAISRGKTTVFNNATTRIKNFEAILHTSIRKRASVSGGAETSRVGELTATKGIFVGIHLRWGLLTAAEVQVRDGIRFDGDHEIGERVQGECLVPSPEHRAYVEGDWGKVALARQAVSKAETEIHARG